MSLVVPSKTGDVLGDAAFVKNLGLRLYCLLPEEPGDNKRALYQSLAALNYQGELERLVERHEKMVAACVRAGIAQYAINMQTTSRLTCGMSQPTLLENGLTLLRPYGVPILPASSVKGTLASWLAEMLADRFNLDTKTEEQTLREAGLLWLFGSSTEGYGKSGEGEPGAVVFFDVLPTRLSLEVDITTVHHQSWYQDGKPPSGFENPTPIPFLTVGKGTQFRFHFLAPAAWQKQAISEDVRGRLTKWGITDLSSPGTLLRQLVVSTGLHKGFGSQTAKGYGRMKEC